MKSYCDRSSLVVQDERVGAKKKSSKVLTDWRLLFEQERARAELAETSAEAVGRHYAKAPAERTLV